MLRKASRRHLERQMELANERRKELVKKLVKTLSVGSYKQNQQLSKKGGIYWLMKGFRHSWIKGLVQCH